MNIKIKKDKFGSLSGEPIFEDGKVIFPSFKNPHIAKEGEEWEVKLEKLIPLNRVDKKGQPMFRGIFLLSRKVYRDNGILTALFGSQAKKKFEEKERVFLLHCGDVVEKVPAIVDKDYWRGQNHILEYVPDIPVREDWMREVVVVEKISLENENEKEKNQIPYSLFGKDRDIRNLFFEVLPDRRYTVEIPDAVTAARKVVDIMDSSVFYHYAGENPLWKNPKTGELWMGDGDMEDFVEIPLTFEKIDISEIEQLIGIWVANFGGKVASVIGNTMAEGEN